MKIIQGLRKSLVKEFGQKRVLKYLKTFLKHSKIETPNIKEYYMMLEKPRLTALYSPEHQLVHALLSENLESVLYSTYPAELMSYQVGKKLDHVFRDLRLFLSAYKKSTPDKTKRTLGVVKWDIKSYGESIPLHEKSKLWQQLERYKLDHLTPWLKNELRAVVTTSYSKEAVESTDGHMSLIRGVSFGMPTTPPILNLYLSDFDRLVVKTFPTIFYRRFGDDCLIVTNEPERLEEINLWVAAELATYELRQHPKKTASFLWSKSGYKTQTHIEILGRSVNFDGRMFLTQAKQEVIVDEWKHLMKKIIAVDSSYVIATWDAYLKSANCEELFLWSNDSDKVRNLSDRMIQLTQKKFNIKKNKQYKSLYTQWHHKC